MKARIATDTNRMNDVEFNNYAETVITKTLNIPRWGTFPANGNPEMLQESLTSLKEWQREAVFHDSRTVKKRNDSRKQTNAIMNIMAHHIEIVAGGDIDILKESGFNVFIPRPASSKSKDSVPTPAIEVEPGSDPREVVAKSRQNKPAGAVEIQCSTSDPTVEENWFHKAVFGSFEQMVMRGFDAGKCYFRARTIGKHGKSAWSPFCSFVFL